MSWERTTQAEPSTFPVPTDSVVATLVGLFRHQGETEIAEVLERATAQIALTSYDNWNGGTSSWTLRLELPLSLFASIEPRLPTLEKAIGAKLTHFDRGYPNDHLNEVTISPLIQSDERSGQQVTPPEYDVKRIWAADRLRMFLSHVATHKVAVATLKEELGQWGIAAFVAHEDIEPTREWRKEIELALKSMNALVALITPDFHGSAWTDQELGWALGRGIPVISVRVGADPYGFAGHVQALNGVLDDPKPLAQALVETLLKNPQIHHDMRRALVAAFRDARSFKTAQALRKLIVTIQDVTEDEKTILRGACIDNYNVKNAYNVPEAIYAAFGKPTPETPATDSAGPSDDEIPF